MRFQYAPPPSAAPRKSTDAIVTSTHRGTPRRRAAAPMAARVRSLHDPWPGIADVVLTFINTVAFGRRCIPAGEVARRSHIPDMLAPRALPGGRLAALGASPYL